MDRSSLRISRNENGGYRWRFGFTMRAELFDSVEATALAVLTFFGPLVSAGAKDEWDEQVLFDEVDANDDEVDIVEELGLGDDVIFESTSSQSATDGCTNGKTFF